MLARRAAGCAILPRFMAPAHPARRRLVLGLAALLTGCAPTQRGVENDRTQAQRERRPTSSNAFRADYAGSSACASCHADIHAAWLESPMHRMTRDAATASIRAAFDGSAFELGEDRIVPEMRDGHRFMRLLTADQGESLYRVTKVIGGRYREDFVGVEVSNPHGQGAEQIMPISFVFSTSSWRYKGYSVLVKERPGLRAGPKWASQCITCHNTLPYLSSVLDDLIGPGAESYQGSVTDDILPSSRRWQFEITDTDELAQALRDELTFLGDRPKPDASAKDLLVQALRATRDSFDERHLIETGVGCESCHGGAREHTRNPKVLPTFEVKSNAFEVVPASETHASNAAAINRACARCHTVLFSRYPYTWEGGKRRGPDPGGSSINSGEARDFLLGGCSGQMSCTSCHDPHAKDDPEKLRALGGLSGNSICLQCHDSLRSDAALRQHTHHRPDGDGSACIGCHMPRKNMGLAYELTRYHRIGSPTDPTRVLGDRPLECALCHPNVGVEPMVRTMERWWGRRYDRAALRRLYGSDLSVNVLESTLAHGKPHEQGVAIGVLGERKIASALPKLLPHLSHEYPLVRFFAKHAIEEITGKPLDVDPNRSASEIARAVESLPAP